MTVDVMFSRIRVDPPANMADDESLAETLYDRFPAELRFSVGRYEQCPNRAIRQGHCEEHNSNVALLNHIPTLENQHTPIRRATASHALCCTLFGLNMQDNAIHEDAQGLCPWSRFIKGYACVNFQFFPSFLKTTMLRDFCHD